jgi:hypothetical protein
VFRCPAISAAIDGYRDKANVAAEQFTMGGQSDPYHDVSDRDGDTRQLQDTSEVLVHNGEHVQQSF